MRSRVQAVLGIDAGTTSVKSVVISTTGDVLGAARSTVRIRRPQPHRAEQDMGEVWSAVAQTISAALAEAGDVELLGLGVTGQGDGAWLVDADGRPVGPAVLWLDGRAAGRVARWETDGRGELIRRTTGSALFPGALPVLLEELQDSDPGLLDRAATQLNCKDWIRFRLTGVRATDASEASRTYLDVATGRYSEELIDGLGHAGFRRLLPPLCPPDAVSGRVTERAARETGLPVGLPVATGLVDTPAGGVGLGVVGPGEVYAILGTTAFVGAVQEHVTAPGDVPLITLNLGRGTHVIECLAPMNGTPNLDWAREATGLAALEWSQIEDLVTAAPAGAGGVLYLPYGGVSGERAPFVDTAASAAWLNITVRTTPGELLRAVYEGIALSLGECMEVLGVTTDATVRLCGGGAQSPVVCQIVADVTGRRIVRSTFAELGARGAGALALVAVGAAPDLAAALDRFGDDAQTFEPDAGLRPLHDAQAQVFRDVRDAVRHHWPTLRATRTAAHTADTRPATTRPPTSDL
ncbi:carbohydrate kinase [Streptomyces sp. J2-1]|uniref:FGGY-family carbohydrate kinase n=1 Tax=Streptomyces corallincola TaxID=2851888 RepID=UPI001C387B3A|nr:FGGY-family carbohydrate kinase [Streptomyces corallincola]MBV2355808.1 carbohydrate kinase [Streptomyces corallincola]